MSAGWSGGLAYDNPVAHTPECRKTRGNPALPVDGTKKFSIRAEPYRTFGIHGFVVEVGTLVRKSSNLGQALESLSSGERAERYRQFAAEAMRKAGSATDADRRAEYFMMASSWHTMAVEAERILDGNGANPHEAMPPKGGPTETQPLSDPAFTEPQKPIPTTARRR